MSKFKNMRIAKIKLVDDALEVGLEGIDDDMERKTTVKSLGSVHPDLIAALQALEPHIRSILCLPAEWCSNAFTIRSVSFSESEKTGIDGIVISCGVELSTCNSPFFFNTPYLPVQRHTDEGDKDEMPAEAIEALAKLRDETEAFLGGKRAQGELFEEAA